MAELDDDFDVPTKKVKKANTEEIKDKPKKKRKGTDTEAVKRIMGSISSGNKYWSPKEGRNVIRILPSNQENGLFFYQSVLHHGFKDETGNRRAYPCLSVFKKPCPVCKVIAKYSNSTEPEAEDVVRNLKPNKKYMMNVIDRATDSVRMFSATKTVAEVIISAFADEDYGDITDPEKGFDVVIRREGQGLATKYHTQFRREPSEIGIDNWEEEMFDLAKEAYREIPTYDEYVNLIVEQYEDVLPGVTKLFSDKKSKVAEEEDELD